MAGKYIKYAPEFRNEIAKLIVESNRSIAEVAREYGLNETTVGGWVKNTAPHTPLTSRRWNCPNAPGCGNSNAVPGN